MVFWPLHCIFHCTFCNDGAMGHKIIAFSAPLHCNAPPDANMPWYPADAPKSIKFGWSIVRIIQQMHSNGRWMQMEANVLCVLIHLSSIHHPKSQSHWQMVPQCPNGIAGGCQRVWNLGIQEWFQKSQVSPHHQGIDGTLWACTFNQCNLTCLQGSVSPGRRSFIARLKENRQGKARQCGVIIGVWIVQENKGITHFFWGKFFYLVN